MLKDSKDNDSDSESQGIVRYVNQWRFCSTEGIVYNLEFFFNDGEATGSELLRQLLRVLCCLSLVDVTVTGVSFDAAGNNRRMVKYLLGGEVTISNGLPKKVSFPNIFLSTDDVIFIWYCTTHNLKSGRNQLLSSTGDIKAARVFHD